MPQDVIEVTQREVEIIEVIERGPVGPTGPQPNINYTVVSSNQTVTSRQLIAADTSGGSFTLTLPLNPEAGDAVDIFDYAETFDTNPLTIARNGQPIESLSEDLTANVEGAYFTLIYTGSTRGWQVVPRFGTSGGGGESTLTTQGDMLYRGVGINTRLPIGTAGQTLRVNSGATAPEWDTLTASDVGAAPTVHTHTPIEVGLGNVSNTAQVTSVTGTAPIVSSGGTTPAISISAATTSAAGSMSGADKLKLDGIAANANNYTHPNHSGDVTSVGDGATTIANDAVTNAKLANVATSTIKGRATAGTGDPEDLSASQVRTILNVADGAEVNVNADWNASSGDAQILNRPSIPSASSATPSALGVAAAGTGTAYAREDHVHAMPSASDVGAASATHASTHAPASQRAQFKGQVSGMTTNVFVRAVTAGEDGNDIVLIFNGVDDIDAIISAWNAANSSNTAELVWDDGSQVPDDFEEIILSGGTAGGSDPLPNPTILESPTGVDKFKLGLGGDSPTGRFVGVTTAGDPLIGILSYVNEGAYNPASEVGSSNFGLTLGANNSNLFVQHFQGGELTAQYDFPDAGGVVAVLENEDAARPSLDISALTEARTISFPDASGTLALTGDIPADVTDLSAGNHKIFYSNGSGEIVELALGDSGEVLTSNGTAAAPSFEAASGGTKTYATFTATDNQPPSSAFATLDTRNSIAVLDFDDAATESAVFVGTIPEAASLGSGLIVRLHFMATTATSGNVRWSVAFERSNTDLDADSFDTATAATVATNGTSGIVTVSAITCTTIDSVTAGDLFRVRVQRLGADAADTMTGDAELVAVEVRSAA